MIIGCLLHRPGNMHWNVRVGGGITWGVVAASYVRMVAAAEPASSTAWRTARQTSLPTNSCQREQSQVARAAHLAERLGVASVLRCASTRRAS